MRRFNFIDERMQRYFYTINTTRELRKLVKSVASEYELLNPHNFPAPLACVQRNNKKTVWNCNESPGFFGNQFERRQNFFSNKLNKFFLSIEKPLTRKYIHRICALSKLAAKIIQKRYNRPTNIVYPGVDYEFYSNGNAQAAIERFELYDSFVLLQVGQITYQKNQMASVLALEKLIPKIPNIRLVIAGREETTYTSSVKAYINLKRLEKHVTFTGPVPDEDVRDLYHACDVNIFPTRLQSFGMAPVEGLCASKIPIVSPECGVSEFLLEHDIGIVSGDLSTVVKDVYEAGNRFQIQASRGNKKVKELLSWEAFSKGVEVIFLQYEKK